MSYACFCCTTAFRSDAGRCVPPDACLAMPARPRAYAMPPTASVTVIALAIPAMRTHCCRLRLTLVLLVLDCMCARAKPTSIPTARASARCCPFVPRYWGASAHARVYNAQPRAQRSRPKQRTATQRTAQRTPSPPFRPSLLGGVSCVYNRVQRSRLNGQPLNGQRNGHLHCTRRSVEDRP